MNLYAQLAAIKADRRIQSTNEDAALLRHSGAVARAIDDITNRHFFSQIATQYYDGNGKSQLWLRDDLLSVTTLAVDNDGDGVYETVLVQDTDFWLWPDNSNPKLRIDLIPNSNKLSVFRAARKSVKVIGMFGFSNDTELTGATLSDDGGGIDLTETVVTLAAGGGLLVSAGETLVVESEQMYASSISGDNVTFVRAINGTTAATHANGLAVYRRRYPEPIERAASLQVTRMLREQQVGAVNEGPPVNPPGGVGGFQYSALYPMIRDLIQPYVRYAIG